MEKNASSAESAFILENYDEAIELFSQAIEADPNNAQALLHRGITYLKTANPAAALQDFAHFKQKPQTPASTYQLHLRKGQAQFQLGEFAAAAESFQHALELASSDAQKKVSVSWKNKTQLELNNPHVGNINNAAYLKSKPVPN